jgi:hypothetical protein
LYHHDDVIAGGMDVTNANTNINTNPPNQQYMVTMNGIDHPLCGCPNETPCATIWYALQQIPQDITIVNEVVVGSGVYLSSTAIHPPPIISDINVIITAQHMDQSYPVIDFNEGQGWQFGGSSHITIRGFRFINSDGQGAIQLITRDMDDTSSPIVASSLHVMDSLFIDNTLNDTTPTTDHAGVVINVRGIDSFIMERCTILNNTLTSFLLSNASMVLIHQMNPGGLVHISDTLFVNNIVNNGGAAAVAITGAAHIRFDSVTVSQSLSRHGRWILTQGLIHGTIYITSMSRDPVTDTNDIVIYRCRFQNNILVNEGKRGELPFTGGALTIRSSDNVTSLHVIESHFISNSIVNAMAFGITIMTTYGGAIAIITPQVTSVQELNSNAAGVAVVVDGCFFINNTVTSGFDLSGGKLHNLTYYHLSFSPYLI